MAIDIGELRGLLSLQDNFSKPVEDAAKGLGVFSESFGAITKGVGLAVAAMGAAGGAIVMLGQRGSEVVAMSGSFDRLTASVGETSAEMLGSMQTATSGLVSNMDLMAAANKAILLGLPVTSQSMGTLAEAAVVLGRAMGQDAKKSLDDLTTALGRSSPMILDNLGLSVKVGEANEAYAKSLGKSAESLTEAEKKQAFYNAAMDAAQAKVAELGGVHLTFGERIQQAKILVGNFVDGLSAAVATSPVLAAGLEAIMKALQNAFGSNSQTLITTVMGYINDFGIFLTHVADVGTSAAEFLLNGWNGMKVGFSAIMEFLASSAETALGALQAMVDKMTAIPIIGKQYEGLNQALKETVVGLGAMKQSFSEQTDEALSKAAAQKVAFDATHKAIADVRDAMIGARDAQTGVSQSSEAAAGGVKKTGAAAIATRDAFQDLVDEMIAYNDQVTADALSIAATVGNLQNELTLANKTGLDKRLAELDIARNKELEGLTWIAVKYPEIYEQIRAMVTEKYQGMSDAAMGHFTTAQQYAEANGFKTRAELQATAEAARRGYEQMLESGLYTEAALQEAHDKAKKAEEEVDGRVHKNKMEQFDLLASSASSILRSMFGKSKAAAIAAALIDTAAAIAKALSAYPWPFNLAPAAAAAAAGYAQVSAIRNTNAEGFAGGTPGTAFEDFGREAGVLLHHQEAVVNVPQGTTLAGMIGDEISAARGDGAHSAAIVEGLRAIDRRLAGQVDAIVIGLRDALMTRPRPA